MPLEKQVWDVLDSTFKSVTPETPLNEACSILIAYSKDKPEASGLVVMRVSGEYMGLLTVKDVLRYILYLYNRSQGKSASEDWLTQIRNQCSDGSLITVNDVMVRHELSVRPNQKLLEVVQIMTDQDVDLLPVMDAGRVIGVVRSIDVLAEITRMAK
jgi:CBS domain-containing protein